MATTYEELALIIEAMSPEQKQQTVTLFVPDIDEYFPAVLAFTDDECDVLDSNHAVLTPE